MSDPAETLLARARAAGVMIATAESCTGGLVASAITDVPGSSDIFDRGFVTYTNAAKTEMLGVSQKTLTLHGAVSEAVAREMAEGALAHSAAQLAVSVTGIAGPGASDTKPEGRVCFAVARRDRPTVTQTCDFGALGRTNVRRRSVRQALHLLLAHLQDEP